MHKLVFFTLLCAYTSMNAQTTVTFNVANPPSVANHTVGIRGNQAPLSWYSSIPLQEIEENTYQISLEFSDTISEIEFKFVQDGGGENIIWENIDNRALSLSQDKIIKSVNSWNVEEVIDIKTLPLLQPTQLMEDYRLVEQMVLEVHPGTYRYQSKAYIQEVLAELKQAFQQPLTHGQAYLAMSKVTAALQCDHTKVGFNNQKRIINSVIHRQSDKLPFTFKWIDKQMILTHNASESEVLQRATSIQKINGVPVSEIYDKMQPYIAADGATDGNRNYKMEVEGFDFRYNAFDVFYPLLFPIPNNQLELEVLPYETKLTQTVTVTPLTRERRSEILYERYPAFPKTRDDMWKFEMIEEGVGKLTLNSFGLMGWKAMTIDYKAFLAEAFEKLKTDKAEHLIIDIRKNTGGFDEMKAELFAYLPFKSKTSIEREGRTRFKDFPDELKPYIQTWGDNPYYYHLKPDNQDEESGYYMFKERKESPPRKSKNKIFNGEVILLTSSANTSLAFYTAIDFRLKNIGTLIGQETGGNLNDINGGQILFLRLPNSNIEIDSPVMGGFTLESNPNQGVVPDILIEPTIESIAENKDLELEAALRLIREK